MRKVVGVPRISLALSFGSGAETPSSWGLCNFGDGFKDVTPDTVVSGLLAGFDAKRYCY